MSKKLCKLVSDGYLDDKPKEYLKMVSQPKYLCKKCGRVSNDEDLLCRPKKMKSEDEESTMVDGKHTHKHDKCNEECKDKDKHKEKHKDKDTHKEKHSHDKHSHDKHKHKDKKNHHDESSDDEGSRAKPEVSRKVSVTIDRKGKKNKSSKAHADFDTSENVLPVKQVESNTEEDAFEYEEDLNMED